MKIFSTILATVILSMANAQNTEIVAYEVNAHQTIQSLRLSPVNSNERTVIASSSIGSLKDSTVCLHLNPSLDYELLVNNTTLIQISSEDIQASFKPEEESSPMALVSMRSWIISEE